MKWEVLKRDGVKPGREEIEIIYFDEYHSFGKIEVL